MLEPYVARRTDRTPYAAPYATPYEHRTSTVRDVRCAPLCYWRRAVLVFGCWCWCWYWSAPWLGVWLVSFLLLFELKYEKAALIVKSGAMASERGSHRDTGTTGGGYFYSIRGRCPAHCMFVTFGRLAVPYERKAHSLTAPQLRYLCP